MEPQSGCLRNYPPFIRHILGRVSRYDRPSPQVYTYFFKRGGWQVQFTEADLKTATTEVTFTDPEKIRKLARRGGACATLRAGGC